MRQKPSAAIVTMMEELKSAARALGFDVREEELMREVGYRARSGACRIGGARVILLDRRGSADDHIEALCAALRDEDLERVFLSPVLRARLARGVSRSAESRAG